MAGLRYGAVSCPLSPFPESPTRGQTDDEFLPGRAHRLHSLVVGHVEHGRRDDARVIAEEEAADDGREGQDVHEPVKLGLSCRPFDAAHAEGDLEGRMRDLAVGGLPR